MVQYILTQEEMERQVHKKYLEKAKAQIELLKRIIKKELKITCEGYCDDCPLSWIGHDDLSGEEKTLLHDICKNQNYSK